jgi:hypothetical protein
MDPNWWRAAIAVGFVGSQALLVYFNYQTQAALRQVESFRLARELSTEFYFREPLYKDVRNAIEACSRLYRSWGGNFNHDDMNKYLGFFEDIGYFQKHGFLDNDLIGHFYGAYVVEAYAHPHVKLYIEKLRTTAKQPTAFNQFERLAKELGEDSRFTELVKTSLKACGPSAIPVPQEASGTTQTPR